MTAVLRERIVGPAAWTGQSFSANDLGRGAEPDWAGRLTEADVDAIDRALAGLVTRGKAFPHFGAEHFPLGAPLEGMLRSLAEELETGRGFFLLRGLPVERYSDEEIATIYFGIGLHLGKPVGQNPQGELIGTVMNVGDIKDKNTRVYQTNAYLPYHTDPSDAVCLLCVRKARTGGLSSLVSAAAVHNELLERHPEYLRIYYRSFHYAHLSTEGPGRSPIFSYHDGKLSCRYLRQYIELGHEERDEPLTAVEREALDVFDAVSQAEDMRLDMMLEPGDMQFANNYAVLHSRSAFEDFDALQERRKLLRLWLKMPNARALAPEFPGRNGFELI